MDPKAVPIIAGALFLLIAVLGGVGFEVRELVVPKVGRVARIVAASFGSFLVLLVVGLIASGGTNGADASANSGGTGPSQSVNFTISDRLGPGQVSEQVVIDMEGLQVGVLNIDSYHPEAVVTVTRPKADTYAYTVATRTVLNVQGQLVEMPGRGQATIRVADGDQFDVTADYTGNLAQVSLLRSR